MRKYTNRFNRGELFKMHFFTSISTNYLPKARVLAESIRERCSDFKFTLVVSDDLPDGFDLKKEPFDEVWFIEDLEIPVDNLNLWIFTHSVVELCTAVKGAAILKLLKVSPFEKIVYLDPDIVVFDDISELSGTLDKYDIVLTPHITVPARGRRDIVNKEICALQHGIFNLGFVAVKKSENALGFAEWWRDRLVDYCHDDIPNGIFTDQRWCDFVPVLFDGVYIEKDCAYNVCTWNLSDRTVTKENGRYFVNGKPLQFYHFSGFDSGAQEAMLKLYGQGEAVWELRKWYSKKQDDNGQQLLGNRSSKYARFSNGEEITREHRVVLRERNDLQKLFAVADPFVVDDGVCYYSWFKERYSIEYKDLIHKLRDERDDKIEELEGKLSVFRRYLAPLLWLRRLFS